MPTALITGASSGLGEEFARQLARENYQLVLTARREDRLNSVAGEAKSLGAPNVHVIAADLSRTDAPTEVHRRIAERGIEIDYLVNNAGFGTHGLFHELPLEREIEEINLNVTSLVALTGLLIPAMVKRGRGTVINVSSSGGFQPVPYMATYGATKAFVLSFSEALSHELRRSGVTVMALCPGLTRTEFQQVAHVNRSDFPSFAFMDAKTVVEQAIASAKRGKRLKVTGLMNLVMMESTRIAPRALVARIAGAMFRGSAV